MKKDYDTAGKRALIRFFVENPDRQFSVDEICMGVNGSLAAKSSVYRRLNALCRDGAVEKFHGGAGESHVYQYTGKECDCSSHFHEKCMRCGRIQHLDCDLSSEFAAHLLAEHGFAINRGKTILYGVCAECRGKEKVHA